MSFDDVGAIPVAAAIAIDQYDYSPGADAGGGFASPAPLLVGADGASVLIRLTTDVAYRAQPARSIVADLGQMIPLGADLAQRMETALHEALANAVIRGNLELAKPRHGGLDGYVEQELMINRLLMQNPELSRRMVTVSVRWTETEIEISVQDEGQGYPARPGDATGDGRGLYIIRAFCDRMCANDGGRRLSMTFTR